MPSKPSLSATELAALRDSLREVEKATGVVAVRHGRRYLGIDLKSEYHEMAAGRIRAELDKAHARAPEKT